MAWAVKADITNQFPEIFVNKCTGGSDDVLTGLILSADAAVAAKLSKRYPNQVTNRTASTTIKTIVVMLTIRKLTNRNHHVGVTKSLADDILFNIDLLNEIASGDSDVPEWTRPNGMKTGSLKHERQTTFQDWIHEREEL